MRECFNRNGMSLEDANKRRMEEVRFGVDNGYYFPVVLMELRKVTRGDVCR